MSESYPLATVEEILDEARNGRMIVLVDDENRENEGDLVIPAQLVTPDAINFMAKHGRGLICLMLTSERVSELGLTLQKVHNASEFETAFTVSIEARSGVTTGISAADRAQTIRTAIDPNSNANDITTPGHIFPLEARSGGVLARAGHTEAAVDIARLAGLAPAGVICEIMQDDGTMARLPELIAFVQAHGLKLGSIADLIAYRARHDPTIARAAETTVRSRFGGEFRTIVYRNEVDATEHIALVKGDITTPEPVLVRVHAVNLLSDVIWDTFEHRDGDFQAALAAIGEEGRGVAVLVFEYDPYPSERILGRNGERDRGPGELREVGVGAQILRDLGVHEMELLSSSPKSVVALEGFGLRIVGHRPYKALEF
jgi:3,4-dihydroxy 2-butanone 4-phosphate synthase/GTP cyclohydrolase II